jgi:hypothetical protein
MTRVTQILLKALLIAYIAYCFSINNQLGYAVLLPAIFLLATKKVNK